MVAWWWLHSPAAVLSMDRQGGLARARPSPALKQDDDSFRKLESSPKPFQRDTVFMPCFGPHRSSRSFAQSTRHHQAWDALVRQGGLFFSHCILPECMTVGIRSEAEEMYKHMDQGPGSNSVLCTQPTGLISFYFTWEKNTLWVYSKAISKGGLSTLPPRLWLGRISWGDLRELHGRS